MSDSDDERITRLENHVAALSAALSASLGADNDFVPGEAMEAFKHAVKENHSIRYLHLFMSYHYLGLGEPP